jgi:hypothetical protein
MIEEDMCDLCGCDLDIYNSYWVFPTKTVTMPAGNEVPGPWYACVICHTLILGGDDLATALATRAAKQEAQMKETEFTDESVNDIKDIHARFRDARTGPPTSFLVEEDGDEV